MKTFQREITDGLGELVKSTASVAYCSPVSLHSDTMENAKSIISNPEVLTKVIAENKDQRDLFYLEAVLVSTGWNKNDDIFTATNTWAARDTPEDKQFNFMHDENDIIGHITGSYVLTKDGQAVSEAVDGPPRPDDFDIITQAVLYNSWSQAENRDRMDKILAEIPEGKWYVSMECLFAGFDYALIDPDGTAKILARDEASAFLTKHLRAYGGTGEYEGYKIGRALSNIAFSGKGLVSKPANPRSVILNSKSTASFHVKNTDSKLSIGEVNMSDQTLLEDQLSETKAELAKAKSQIEVVKAKIEEAKDTEFATKVEAYEAAAKQAQASIDELSETIKSTQARVAELEDALATSKEALTTAEQHMTEMKQKEKAEKRKAALVEAGLNEDEVSETLGSFDALDDDAFDSIVAMVKNKANFDNFKKKGDDDKDDKDDKKKDKKKDAKADEETEASEEAATDALDDVESSEAELNVGNDSEDEAVKAQASISEWFGTHVLTSK
jgi:hypothetical protein